MYKPTLQDLYESNPNTAIFEVFSFQDLTSLHIMKPEIVCHIYGSIHL